jgi:hypothetical protein
VRTYAICYSFEETVFDEIFDLSLEGRAIYREKALRNFYRAGSGAVLAGYADLFLDCPIS